MKYMDIPVLLNDKTILVNYEYLEDKQLGKVCVVTSEGKKLVLNEELATVSNDFPQEWIQPVVDTLTKITNEEGF